MENGKPQLRFTRPHFIDAPFDTEALWAAAEMWRGWIPKPAFAPAGSYRLLAEVWGFARGEGAALRESLTGPAVSVKLEDPDRLITAGPWLSADVPVAMSTWLAPLLSPACAGLFIVLRMEARTRRHDAPESRGPVKALVLAGSVIDGALLLKACGQSGRSPIEEHLSRGATWEHEAAFLQAHDTFLRTFRADARASAGAAGVAEAVADAQLRTWHLAPTGLTTFPLRPLSRLVDFLARHFVEFPDDRSPRAFVRRCASAVGVIAAGLYLIAAYSPRPIAAPGLLIAVFGAVMLYRVLWTKGVLVYRYHREMTSGLRRLFDSGIEVEEITIPPERLADPALRKYSAEFAAAGAEFCYDFRLTLPSQFGTVHRLYVARGCDAYVALGSMGRTGDFKHFPTIPIINLTTRFTDGAFCVTISDAHTYRSALDPRVVGAVRAGTCDPVTLLRRHAELVDIQVRAGRTTEAVDPKRFPALTLADHEDCRLYYLTHPVHTWGDALHEAFDVPRKLETLVVGRTPPEKSDSAPDASAPSAA